MLSRTKHYLLTLALLSWVHGALAVETHDVSAEEMMPFRDPFTPSPLMYQIRGTELDRFSSVGTFNPNGAIAADIPDMRLRGFVADDTEKMLALLEVVGRGVFMVREGDEININPRRPSEAIRITSITRLGVTVETGTIGKIRILK